LAPAVGALAAGNRVGEKAADMIRAEVRAG
jgi:hypothetical protein